jgi:hypothetical protein
LSYPQIQIETTAHTSILLYESDPYT